MIWTEVIPTVGDPKTLPKARLLYGEDVLTGLREVAPASIHCVVTSPPYFALRDYEDASGQIGQENTTGDFITRLVEVFREVSRVLRTDGTVWLNLGDTYMSKSEAATGLKVKDLANIPARVASALQADGWYLRAACPWIKRSTFPESCTDRPSTGVEMVFLLAHPKSGGKYFYDIYGSRKPLSAAPTSQDADHTRQRRCADLFFESVEDIVQKAGQGLLHSEEGDPLVVLANSVGYKGGHPAVFPPQLVRPLILSSTSAYGACAACGAQWERDIDLVPMASTAKSSKHEGDPHWQQLQPTGRMGAFKGGKNKTVGWKPTCACDSAEVKHPVVLDFFCGSGTTGAVAVQSGRAFVGIDLNTAYLPQAVARIRGDEAPVTQSGGETGDVLDMFL